jgi:hypothetical protein
MCVIDREQVLLVVGVLHMEEEAVPWSTYEKGVY